MTPRLPQSQPKVTQSRPKAPSTSKGWKACVRFLRKGRKEMRKAHPNSLQLLRIIECSDLMQGYEAEVNWYTGGNKIVTLPTAVAVAEPGVYLAKAKYIPMQDLDEEDQGPQSPGASITCLRWLGTASEFIKMTKESQKALGKKKHDRLMEMLQCSCGCYLCWHGGGSCGCHLDGDSQ